MTNATEISKPLKRTNPGPIDVLYGPYDSLFEACKAVPNAWKEVDEVDRNFRTGQVIGLNTPTGIVEYWWPKDTRDQDLVLKDTKVDLSNFATVDDFNSISSGIQNATLETQPKPNIFIYNVDVIGVYEHFNDLEVTDEDLNTGIVQFRLKGQIWEKNIIPIADINPVPVESSQIGVVGASGKIYRNGDTITNVIKTGSGYGLNYRKVESFADGSPMSDSHVDNDLYIKIGNEYFIEALDLSKSRTLIVNSVNSMQTLSRQDATLIRLGYYGRIETKGYYTPNDGGGIDYDITIDNVGADDGFLIIRPGIDIGIKFSPNIKGSVNIKIAGAKSNNKDQRDVIQNAIDSLPEGSSILFPSNFTISDSLYVNKRMGFDFKGDLIQTNFDRPNIVVDNTSDVSIIGNPSCLYLGERPNIKSAPVATSTDSRLNQIFANFAGIARDLSVGILLHKRCDRFRSTPIYVLGKAIGMALYTSGSDLFQYSRDISIDGLNVNSVDFGLYSGGFINLSIGAFNATNITNTQGDPSHAIYITQRNVNNQNLSIGSLNVNGANQIPSADRYMEVADALSIRSTTNAVLNNVNIEGCQYIGNAINCYVRINSLVANLTKVRPGVDPQTGFLLIAQAQSGGTLDIGYANITCPAEWQPGDVDGTLFSASADGSVIIRSGVINMTAQSPVRVGRLATSGKRMDLENLQINYASEFKAGYSNPSAIINLSPSGALNVFNPSLSGCEHLFYNGIGSAKWKIKLDQTKLSSNTNNTIIDATGAYNVEFITSPTTQIQVPSFTGNGTVQMRGRNALKIVNSAPAGVAQLSGLSDGQTYCLKAGDTLTQILHNSLVKTRDGRNIAAGTWDMFFFTKTGSVATELYTVYKDLNDPTILRYLRDESTEAPTKNSLNSKYPFSVYDVGVMVSFPKLGKKYTRDSSTEWIRETIETVL